MYKPGSTHDFPSVCFADTLVSETNAEDWNFRTKAQDDVFADSGFARDGLLSWCEANNVDYVFGLAKNDRLIDMVKAELAAVKAIARETGTPARMFKELRYRTLNTWSCERRPRA